MAKNPKKYDNDLLVGLAKALLSGQSSPQDIAANKMGIKTKLDDANNTTYDWGNVTPTDDQLKKLAETEGKATAMQDVSEGVSLPQLGSLAMQSVSEHPFKAAGLGALGFGNLGGLTDNNKFGGQLGGLALGGLGAHALASGNPYMQAMLTLGGGELGALFDKLRAKKEQEQAIGYANAGNPIAMMQRR